MSKALRSAVMAATGVAVWVGIHFGATTLIAQLEEADALRWQPKQIDVEQYRSVIEGNMFTPGSKRRAAQVRQQTIERAAAPAATPEPRPTAPPRDPDQDFVVVGVSIHAGHGIAFIEDRNQNKVIRVEQGGQVAQGQITQITLDGVTYVVGDEQREIALQQSLAGTSATSSSAGSTAATKAGATQTAGSSAASDILERMRQRRKQATASPQASE